MNLDRFDVPLIDMDAQSPKDCKKQTPNYKDANPKKGIAQEGFKVKDNIYVKGTSIYNKTKLDNEMVFDSYDKYDNTCYVTHPRQSFTYNVLLSDIRLL